MELPDEIYEKIMNEVKSELKSVPSRKEGGAPTFDDLEDAILSIRQKFGEKLMQAALDLEAGEEVGKKKLSKVQQRTTE